MNVVIPQLEFVASLFIFLFTFLGGSYVVYQVVRWFLRGHMLHVAPNQLAILSGKQKYKDPENDKTVIRNFRIVHGQSVVKMPWVEVLSRLNLGNRSISISIRQQLTKDKMRINIEAEAIIKVNSDPKSLHLIAEQFCGQSEEEVNKQIVSTTKARLSQLVNNAEFRVLAEEPDALNQRIEELVVTVLTKMGMDLKTLTISGISDEDGLIDAMVRASAEKIRRELEAEIKEQERISQERIGKAETGIKKQQRENEVQQLGIDKDFNEKQLRLENQKNEDAFNFKKDDSERQQKTYAIEEALEQRKLEYEMAMLRKEKQLELERLKTELESTEAQRTVDEQKLDAVVTKAQRQADASMQSELMRAKALRAQLFAEAEGKERLAKALGQMDESARQLLVMKELPIVVRSLVGEQGVDLEKILSAIAKPMENIDSVRIVNFGGQEDAGAKAGLTQMAELVPDVLFKTWGKFQYLKEALEGATPGDATAKPEPRKTTGPSGKLSELGTGENLDQIVAEHEEHAANSPEAPTNRGNEDKALIAHQEREPSDGSNPEQQIAEPAPTS